MITKQDLLEAIAECQGVRDPRANTAIKLAAFYTILDHLEYDERPQPKMVQNEYSFSGLGESNEPEKIHTDGGSDFLRLIDGKSQSDVWPVMDELMSTIQVLNEKLYRAVTKKLSAN